MSQPTQQESTQVEWMTLPEVLHTKRMVLRPLRRIDAATIFQRLDHDPTVSRYMRWPQRGSVEETEQATLRTMQRRQQGITLSWVMTLPDDDLPLGFIGLIPEGHMAELSYILAQDALGPRLRYRSRRLRDRDGSGAARCVSHLGDVRC